MPKKIPDSVSIILSVYNEMDLLERAARHTIDILSRDFEDFELILIDDGSDDGTGELIEKLAQDNGRIRVWHNLVNLNVGISIQTGMRMATKDYAVFNGVDLPLAVEDISGLIQKMKHCDVLVLERETYAGYTKWRWITSKINRVFLRLLFGFSDLRDMNFTQIYRREILHKIMPLAKSPAFTLPEMILRAKRLGLKVQTIKVQYRIRPSGRGAFGKPHDIFWTTYDMLRFRFKIWKRL